MYVTRRLLRSTLPPESEKEKETSFLPSTPRRRAAVRACAKIDEIADVSGPAARNKAIKTLENAGDEKNKRSHQKKVKKEEKHKTNKEAPALDVSSLHGYQLMVDVHYRGEQYTEARVLDLDPEKQLLFVHYMGWNARFDAWVPAEELAAHGSHTNVTKKKDVSWDGNTPLFMTEEELATHRQGGKIKPKKAMKKRTVLSPKARQAARKALQSVNTDVNEMKEREEAQPVKRVGRKSPKTSKKSTSKHPRAGKKSPKSVASSARRTPRRVQVAVGTTDEDSELQNDSEAADLVLDVEIEGHEASNDEPEEEGAEREEEYEEASSSRKARKKQRKESPGSSKRKRDLSYDEVEENSASSGTKRSPTNKKKPKSMASTPTKTTPLPPRSSRGGLGSAAREKLAAIFRQRIQEREQMQQLNGSHTGFQQTLQDSAVEPTAADTTSSAAEETEAKNKAMVNPEVAAAEEYQRQLQQYYYHQQLMLANSLHMNATGGEDPSTFRLQGGIMDPRIIQERLTALEERRRQQAHVQAYYHQLMLTRERNVRALAANQAFMAASAAVWEQQLKETQSEDGTSSVTSWKDVTGADASEMSKTDKTAAASSSEADESSKSDSESVKESEMSAASAVTSNNAAVTSPDTVEKTAERCTSAKTSPTKSVSDKSDPADPPTQGVLYEFVL